MNRQLQPVYDSGDRVMRGEIEAHPGQKEDGDVWCSFCHSDSQVGVYVYESGIVDFDPTRHRHVWICLLCASKISQAAK